MGDKLIPIRRYKINNNHAYFFKLCLCLVLINLINTTEMSNDNVSLETDEEKNCLQKVLKCLWKKSDYNEICRLMECFRGCKPSTMKTIAGYQLHMRLKTQYGKYC